MFVVEFGKFISVEVLIGLTGPLFKKNIAAATAATAAIVARTIAAMAPPDNPFFFEDFLPKVFISGLYSNCISPDAVLGA